MSEIVLFCRGNGVVRLCHVASKLPTQVLPRSVERTIMRSQVPLVWCAAATSAVMRSINPSDEVVGDVVEGDVPESGCWVGCGPTVCG